MLPDEGGGMEISVREDNILMLNDTLKICKVGSYEKNGKKIMLQLSKKEMEEVIVYLPSDIRNMAEDKDFQHIIVGGRVGVGCENMDSFSLARKRVEDCRHMMAEGDRVLVLNFANAVNPGGGVRRGATAQEEDLCRKSSLLLSLESKEALAYYDYNKALNTYMGSDAIILNPNVEILKDENGNLLEKSVVVSVLTCAAPNLRNGMECMTEAQYQKMMYDRITAMLTVAACNGYKVVILGAFGCGAFRNDAKLVSDIFYKVMKEFKRDTLSLKDCFERIDFALLDTSADQYNFKEFSRNFKNFYQAEDDAEVAETLKVIKEKEKNLDRIRGCLIGGAAGDALGYAIEFNHESSIFAEYGKDGITEYRLDKKSGKALISDDTQMTLFTGNGLLVGSTRAMRGIGAAPHTYVENAYHDWLLTQDSSMKEVNAHERFTKEGGRSWLLDVPELYSHRASGNTCLSALRHPKKVEDYLRNSVNDSKGCGGIMRVAPIALLYNGSGEGYIDIHDLDREGAYIAAITHGHPLGYMPAAVVTHIINRLVYGPKASLKDIVIEAKKTWKSLKDLIIWVR